MQRVARVSQRQLSYSLLLIVAVLLSARRYASAVLAVIMCPSVRPRGGVGHFEHKFNRNGGSPNNGSWRQKARFPAWVITWRCLRDPTFSGFDTVTIKC